jgi:hypothetical protein
MARQGHATRPDGPPRRAARCDPMVGRPASLALLGIPCGRVRRLVPVRHADDDCGDLAPALSFLRSGIAHCPTGPSAHGNPSGRRAHDPVRRALPRSACGNTRAAFCSSSDRSVRALRAVGPHAPVRRRIVRRHFRRYLYCGARREQCHECAYPVRQHPRRTCKHGGGKAYRDRPWGLAVASGSGLSRAQGLGPKMAAIRCPRGAGTPLGRSGAMPACPCRPRPKPHLPRLAASVFYRWRAVAQGGSSRAQHGVFHNAETTALTLHVSGSRQARWETSYNALWRRSAGPCER